MRKRTLYLSELLERYFTDNDEKYGFSIFENRYEYGIRYPSRSKAIEVLKDTPLWNKQVKQWRILAISIQIILE